MPLSNLAALNPVSAETDPAFGAKLKEIAPDVKRVAVIRDPSVPAGSGGLAAIQIVAPSLGVELTPVGVRDAGEIERAITAFARGSNGGLILDRIKTKR
jgi:ABC-type uncharacterized transport system substrate-binding protein